MVMEVPVEHGAAPVFFNLDYSEEADTPGLLAQVVVILLHKPEQPRCILEFQFTSSSFYIRVPDLRWVTGGFGSFHSCWTGVGTQSSESLANAEDSAIDVSRDLQEHSRMSRPNPST